MDRFSRRRMLALVAGTAGSALVGRPASAQSFDPERIYGPVQGEPFPIAGINIKRLRPQFLRTAVAYESGEQPGTIVIDPASHFLFLTDGRGGAIRYGVGVGRQGFSWSGDAAIQAKREWPDWYPPKEMMARDPRIMASMTKLQSGLGMAGGLGNPLGARAMYLYQNNKDTLYRIHGTVEPYSIGTSVSSGCIRMINQDAIDLFNRVAIGTRVVVLGAGVGAQSRVIEEPQQLDDGQGYEPEPQYQPATQDRAAPRYAAPQQYDPYDPYGFDQMGYDPNQ